MARGATAEGIVPESDHRYWTAEERRAPRNDGPAGPRDAGPPLAEPPAPEAEPPAPEAGPPAPEAEPPEAEPPAVPEYGAHHRPGTPIIRPFVDFLAEAAEAPAPALAPVAAAHTPRPIEGQEAAEPPAPPLASTATTGRPATGPLRRRVPAAVDAAPAGAPAAAGSE